MADALSQAETEGWSMAQCVCVGWTISAYVEALERRLARMEAAQTLDA
jgi:hypothetical protein